MIKIAITGTIGSGKSFCCDIIKQYGYEVFDCDLQVKKILDDKNVQNEISELLNINFNDGIDYRIIADVVFNDNQLLLSYENIIFNELIIKLNNAIDNSKNEIFFAEVPLLFEKNFDIYFDQSWLVVSDDKNIIERLTNKRNFTLDDINRRLKLQMSVELKKSKATFIINNNLDVAYLSSVIYDKIHSMKKG